MTTKILKGALIGCGYFAQNHLAAWAEIEGAEITAVCDLDRQRATACAAKFNIENIFADAEEMLAKSDLDFVDIVTTSPTHRPLVELVAKHRCAIICQKPLAENLADAKAMVEAAQSAGVPFFVHENFRWQRAFVEMASQIGRGAVGTPRFARFSFRHGFDIYQNQPYLARIEQLAIMDIGLHLFDLARFFLGEVSLLACHTQRRNPDVRGEDSFSALLSHTSGAVCEVDSSFSTVQHPDPFPQTLARIEGDLGTLDLEAGFRLTLHQKGRRQSFDVEPEVPAWGQKPGHVIQDAVIRFQRHVVTALLENTTPQPSGADNLRTLDLAMSAYRSADLGQTISLKTGGENSP